MTETNITSNEIKWATYWDLATYYRANGLDLKNTDLIPMEKVTTTESCIGLGTKLHKVEVVYVEFDGRRAVLRVKVKCGTNFNSNNGYYIYAGRAKSNCDKCFAA